MSMPTIEQVVSRCLFDQDTPPANFNNESLVNGIDLLPVSELTLD
jgi:hypothetical protein